MPRNPAWARSQHSLAKLSSCDPVLLLWPCMTDPSDVCVLTLIQVSVRTTFGFWPCGPFAVHPSPPDQLLSDWGFTVKCSPSRSILVLPVDLFHPTSITISLVWSWASPSDSTPSRCPGKSGIKELASRLGFGAGIQPGSLSSCPLSIASQPASQRCPPGSHYSPTGPPLLPYFPAHHNIIYRASPLVPAHGTWPDALLCLTPPNHSISQISCYFF